MTDNPAAAPPPPKVDPETLVLRGSPGRVVRFRKRAMVALAALASTAIVGIAWMALKPATFRIIAQDDRLTHIAAKAPADALADAPQSYGDIPKLGPPLPGDLGRPILDHQRSTGTVESGASRDGVAATAAQDAEAERQRIAAERKAARESGIMMQLSGSPAKNAVAPTDVAVTPAAAAAPADVSQLAVETVRDPHAQQRKADSIADWDGAGDVRPYPVIPAASPWTLSAGSVIAASLITGLNSDLPGVVTAQVTENVYDSATGRILLIPQGSRLIGSYDHMVAFGQSRALVVWRRLILPDGSSVHVDNVPATDTAGYAGLADQVDRHTWQLLKGVGLSTLLGVGAELSIDGEGDLVRALREATQQSAGRAGDQIVSKGLDIKPTITVRPGWPLRVLVHKDLVLEPWRG